MCIRDRSDTIYTQARSLGTAKTLYRLHFFSFSSYNNSTGLVYLTANHFFGKINFDRFCECLLLDIPYCLIFCSTQYSLKVSVYYYKYFPGCQAMVLCWNMQTFQYIIIDNFQAVRPWSYVGICKRFSILL